MNANVELNGMNGREPTAVQTLAASIGSPVTPTGGYATAGAETAAPVGER